MKDLAGISDLIESRPDLLNLFRHVETLGLSDGWIGAGLIRNAVWDALHGWPLDHQTSGDVDVIFFDASNPSSARDEVLETHLRDACPGIPWSVKNQARMHLRNGDNPYQDSADAMCHWPETATAIAARLRDGHVEVMAPLGIDDLLGLVVRPTPHFTGSSPPFVNGSPQRTGAPDGPDWW
jgi:uncharacterized protein